MPPLTLSLIIPARNAKHLALRKEVVDAVEASELAFPAWRAASRRRFCARWASR